MAPSLLSRLLSRLSPSASGEPPAPDALEREYLAALRQYPLPLELAAPTPRPDVWGRQGYLAQPHYHARFKPLLTHGFATWGLVYHYVASEEDEQRAVEASYAWLDAHGRLRTSLVREEYEPAHALATRGQGQMVLDVDAGLERGRRLVIVQEPHGPDHVVYGALGITELLSTAPPEEQELAGTLLLEWLPGRRFHGARVLRALDGQPLFTLEREALSGNDWRVLREPGAVRLRVSCGTTLVPGISFHFHDGQGRHAAGAVIRASGRISLEAAGRQFLIGLGVERQNVVWEGERVVLTTEPEDLTAGKEEWVLHEPLPWPLVEVLVAGVVALGHAQRHAPEPTR